MSEFLNSLESLLNWAVDTGEPLAGAFMTIVVIAIILSYAIWRIKSELRGIKWNDLTFEERKAKIEALIYEAIQTAEWMYSHLSTSDTVRKNLIISQSISDAKLSTAIQYTKQQLTAAGASRQDLATVPLAVEKTLTKLQPNKTRFGAQTAPVVDQELPF